jgi:23S rRNA (uridine2552-2'-O)-methyltransferase
LLGNKGKLIALDILPMEPVPEVEFICGDFREESVLKQLEQSVGEHAVDVVMSDMAPNMSGINVADSASSLYLCELALDFARAHLKSKGVFVTKVFQGDGFDGYIKAVRQAFETVTIRKPKASRPRSREVYLVARNFRAV